MEELVYSYALRAQQDAFRLPNRITKVIRAHASVFPAVHARHSLAPNYFMCENLALQRYVQVLISDSLTMSLPFCLRMQ
jgi:hypothetical protein